MDSVSGQEWNRRTGSMLRPVAWDGEHGTGTRSTGAESPRDEPHTTVAHRHVDTARVGRLCRIGVARASRRLKLEQIQVVSWGNAWLRIVRRDEPANRSAVEFWIRPRIRRPCKVRRVCPD